MSLIFEAPLRQENIGAQRGVLCVMVCESRNLGEEDEVLEGRLSFNGWGEENELSGSQK